MASDKLLKSFLDLMEEKNWVLRLQAGAEKVHQFLDPLEGSTGVGGSVKKEELKVEVKKEIKVNKGILNGRPFLREAIDVSQLNRSQEFGADPQAE
jgi:autonomous glycyl radical cofactor GrcA